MDGNNYPMDLATVQHLAWSSDGTVATGRDNAILAYRATLSGYLLALLSVAKVTRMSVVSDRWIRTDTWSVPGLRLLHDSYWIYRVSPDVMLRVVYSPTGKLLWKYRLVKILTPAGVRTLALRRVPRERRARRAAHRVTRIVTRDFRREVRRDAP